MLTDLLILIAGTAALLSALGLTMLTVLRRQVEVSPRYRARVPIRWIAHPGEAASLTRRLRRAVLALRMVVPTPRRRDEPTRQQELAEQLEQLASATARELVLVSMADRRQRSAMLVPLRGQVAKVEQMSKRLVADAAALDPDRPDPGEWDRRMRQIEEELIAREAARRDLATVERAAGLLAHAPEAHDLAAEGSSPVEPGRTQGHHEA